VDGRPTSVVPQSHRLSALAGLRSGWAGTPLAQRIYEDVAIQIVEGRLQGGDELNTVDLARVYQSSRTPVREALIELQRAGLVVVPARRRPYVTGISVDEVGSLYQLRATLYALTSELVVRNGTDEEIESLWYWQAELERAVEVDDVDAYFWGNVEFRNAEARIAKNPDLERMLGPLGLRTLRFRHLSLSRPGRLERSAADHRRLLVAYQDRDVALAVALTRSLVMTGLGVIRSGDGAQELGSVVD
jgi:DNA-binding GntR family transcriptional regulator